FVPIAHIVAVVFTIIELGLVAYLVSTYDGGSYGYGYGWYWNASPDRLNFQLFTAVWSLLVLAYVGLTPLYMTSIFHKLAALALESITMIFWFAGSIALAVFFGAPACHGNIWCGSFEAAIAFGFFLWAIFLFLVVLDAIEALRSR
ncbi:hypothetical protein M406DRAFT_224267, partial [Cryphonectria parasitica EP155]